MRDRTCSARLPGPFRGRAFSQLQEMIARQALADPMFAKQLLSKYHFAGPGGVDPLSYVLGQVGPASVQAAGPQVPIR
jgi:hypothetical protein